MFQQHQAGRAFVGKSLWTNVESIHINLFLDFKVKTKQRKKVLLSVVKNFCPGVRSEQNQQLFFEGKESG